jgi:hypothetical protein
VGTAGFFLDEGGDGKRLFLVTVRHVVFPPNKERKKAHDMWEEMEVSVRALTAFQLELSTQ